MMLLLLTLLKTSTPDLYNPVKNYPTQKMLNFHVAIKVTHSIPGNSENWKLSHHCILVAGNLPEGRNHSSSMTHPWTSKGTTKNTAILDFKTTLPLRPSFERDFLYFFETNFLKLFCKIVNKMSNPGNVLFGILYYRKSSFYLGAPSRF